MSQIYNWESKAIRPLDAVNTASAFSKWVFEQSVDYKVQDFFIQSKNMKLGIDAHQSIDDFFRREWSNKLDVGSDSPSDWIVEHTEQDGRAGKFYKASSLKVNNKPLHCSPDVLLRHKSKSQVVIIERKTTRNNYHTIPAKYWLQKAIDSTYESYSESAKVLYAIHELDNY